MMKGQHFISVMGVKDGVGASHFCLELAATLSKNGGRVLLIDGDVDHPGDLKIISEDSHPWRTVADLQKLPRIATGGMVASFLRGSLDLSVLQLLPTDGSFAKSSDPIFSCFDWILGDFGSRWHPVAIEFFKKSSLLLFILNPVMTQLQALKRKTEALAASFFPLQRLGFLANRWDAKTFLKAGDVEHFAAITCFGKNVEEAHLKLKGLVSPNGDLAPFLPERLLGEKKTAPTFSVEEKRMPQETAFKGMLLKNIKQQMEAKGLKADQNEEGIRDKIRMIVHEVLSRQTQTIPQEADRTNLTEELLDELLGLGPLEKLLQSPDNNEILVNGCDPIYVEEKGRLKKTALHFSNRDFLDKAIERILAPCGRRVDVFSPMVDARLPCGSRVNIIIPPLALNGPIISIRRFSKEMLGPDDLIRSQTASAQTLSFLKEAVLNKMNILVSGGTGSGKTTLLNLLSSFISEQERIITIEDAAELRLNQPHVVRLESRPANIEGKGAIAIRDLVRNALRMRPDRIVVGECRGAEALDMLQAMNTGHEGSLTTLHANSPRDALSRLETLVMFAEMELPSKAIREQIASAIDIVVQIARGADGNRKIVSIVKLSGMEGDVFTLEEIDV